MATVKLKPVAEQTIVITGASSGIGLATAQAAAKQGARVVLTARNADALAKIVDELRAAGGQAVAVPADVADPAAVERVAREATSRFGGFDTWVNNAGVGLWAKLEDASEVDARRLFDTNFWGLVNGCKTALPTLKARGGALVNVGSVVSDTVFPIQGIYIASKHAVEGYTDALRQELLMDDAPVSVTLIRPAAIDTPFPKNAKNYFAQEPKLPAPVYKPEDVAGAILHAAAHPVRDLHVGGGGRVMSGLYRHFPETMDWVAGKVTSSDQFEDAPARHHEGSLHRAGTAWAGRVRGEHPGMVRPVSVYTQIARHPLLTLGLVAALGAAAAGAIAATHDGDSA